MEVPDHATILKKQPVHRRGPHNYMFSELFDHHYFDYGIARQKYGWSVDQLRNDCAGTELYLMFMQAVGFVKILGVSTCLRFEGFLDLRA